MAYYHELIFYIISLGLFGYLYYKIYEKFKNCKISSFNDFIKLVSVWVYLPFFLLLSILIYIISKQQILALLPVIISSIIIYYHKLELHEIFLYVPLIFFKEDLLFLLSLIFSMVARKNFYFYIPLGLLFYSILVLSSFQTFAIFLQKLLPYFLIILIKFVLDFRKEILKYIPIFLTAGISYAFLYISDIHALLLVILSILVYLKLKWDERIPIAFAMFYLILAAIALAKGYEDFANELAIVTYWNLVIGVITAFIRTLKENGNT